MLSTRYEWPQEDLGLEITVECPYCGGETEVISTWGSYPTSTGDVRRYRCKKCKESFNPAKIPYWCDKVQEFVWKISQMVIKDRVAVNALARMWRVPETTLRTLVSAVKDFLVSNLEFNYQLLALLRLLVSLYRSLYNVYLYKPSRMITIIRTRLRLSKWKKSNKSN